jgi:uncharacterized protein
LLDLALNKHFHALFPGVRPCNLDLVLYGGEPLQPSNVPIIKEVLEYAGKYGARTSAISNCSVMECVGGLLGPLPGYINEVQVTLDAGSFGGRVLQRAGGKEFSRIITNIHLMLDRKVAVSIRMHLIGDNYAGLRDMVDYLVEQDIVGHPLCFPHLAPLQNYSARVPSGLTQRIDVNNPAAREISEKFGYPLNSRIKDVRTSLASHDRRLARTFFCMHNTPNSYVLDPGGDLYGCYVEAGRKKYLIGRINREGVVFNGNLRRNLSRNVGSIDNCLDCPYALLCGGGCAYNANFISGSIFSPDCAGNKESIAAAIRFSSESRKKSAF